MNENQAKQTMQNVQDYYSGIRSDYMPKYKIVPEPDIYHRLYWITAIGTGALFAYSIFW